MPASAAFKLRSGGTIFIDEIGDFEPVAQAKLLRVLETYTVCPIGSNEDIHVDVRVVAATSRNLQDLVASGQFREDLFYRLNVVVIRLPPLRDRPEDIPLLADVFLQESAEACGRGPMTFDQSLKQFFMRQPWPGNVRQLRNLIFSMVVMARNDTLSLSDLPPEFSGGYSPSAAAEPSRVATGPGSDRAGRDPGDAGSAWRQSHACRGGAADFGANAAAQAEGLGAGFVSA